MRFTAVATPEESPPPPTGARTTSTSGQSMAISLPTAGEEGGAVEGGEAEPLTTGTAGEEEPVEG